MTSEGTLGGYVRYGRTLVDSGVNGMRKGGQSYLAGQPLSGLLSDSARSSLGLAALGVCAGLAQLYLGSNRKRVPRSVALGTLGAAAAFCVGFTWKTRQLTASMVQGARKEIGSARDERWLETHPIDYA